MNSSKDNDNTTQKRTRRGGGGAAGGGSPQLWRNFQKVSSSRANMLANYGLCVGQPPRFFLPVHAFDTTILKIVKISKNFHDSFLCSKGL